MYENSVPVGLNIAVFASGKGSNLLAILDAIAAGTIPSSRVVVVISNNSSSGALDIARSRHIPAVHLSRAQFDSDESFTEKVSTALREREVNFIALAGYMKKLDPLIVKNFKNRIVNIHPALLPKFGGQGMYGHRVHEAVIASREKVSGATVHIVDEEYDRGPVVLSRQVTVENGDTADSLAARVLKIEHVLYPEAIRLFAEGKVKIDGRRVSIIEA